MGQWLWPGLVVIGSILLMGLGLVLAQPTPIASTLCKASDSPEQCQLATQIVADQVRWDAMKADALPLPVPEEPREQAVAIALIDCGDRTGAVNAGHTARQAFNGDVVASRAPQLREIFPGILLVDVEYPKAEGAGTVRTACISSNRAIPNTVVATQPFEVASAVIPVNWPTEAYDNSQALGAARRAQQLSHPLFVLGSTLLFTIAGLFAAAMLRMAVTTANLAALSQAAIAMGIFEGIFELLLPLNGVLMLPLLVARKSLALGLAGAIVPRFKVDWSDGYRSVAGCVAVMVLVHFVLRGLMILTILGGNAA